MSEASAGARPSTQVDNAPDESTHDPQNRGASEVPQAPRGWKHLIWLGPAFLWMVSAAGSGELLFTPRIAAQYGYTLLWALLAAVGLKWFINHEIGRWAVCSGTPVLSGFSRLPGPKNWAVWLILVPQALNAIVLTAGMAGSAATAAILLLPGGTILWTIVLVLFATGLALWGKYDGVEKVATVLAMALAVAGVAGAIMVFPAPGELAAGLVPSMPRDANYAEILPWLGFMMSGAAGLMWYSYWISAKGYGAAGAKDDSAQSAADGSTSDQQAQDQAGDRAPVDVASLSDESKQRLKGWLKQMTLDNTVAVVGTVLPTIGFLILGAELLRPQGLLPEEDKIAEVIGRLLGGVFGTWGYWLMVIGVFIGFTGTLISQQDGFGRLFADGTRSLAQGFGLAGRWIDKAFLKRAYIIVLLTVLPLALYLVRGEPVGLLKIAGAIEAAHIPIVTALVLYLNQRLLPKELRPGWFLFGVTVLAALFFAGFAAAYIYFQVTGKGG